MKQLSLFQSDEPTDQDLERELKLLDLIANPDCKVLIAFSGGKDSVAMVLSMLEMGIDKSRIELHHHDVDGHGPSLFDWPCTPSYCQAFADAMELPLYFSHAEGGILREMYREGEGKQDVMYQPVPGGEYKRLPAKPGNTTRRMWPAVSNSLMTRWCSAVAKIDVLSRVVNDRFRDECDLLILTGERRQESPARDKYEAFIPYRSKTKKRNAWQWRPILEWKEDRVWGIIERWGIQPHPCYELGWSRCSCLMCIYSSPKIWSGINEVAPHVVDEVERIEKDLDHTLYNGIGIRQRFYANEISMIPAGAKERWMDEAMGKFKSDIFVNNWQLPAGAYGTEGCGSD